MKTSDVKELCSKNTCLLLERKGINVKSTTSIDFSGVGRLPRPTQQFVLDALYKKGVHIYTTVYCDDEMGDLFMAHCQLKMKSTGDWAPVNTVFPACSSRHTSIENAIIFALKNLI